MEWLLLCALVVLRPLDAVDAANTQGPSFQARTTRGLPLCPEGSGQQLQHLNGPTGQGTPCPSLTTDSLTTRLDRSRWPTDGSLETKDSSSLKDGSWKYWTDKTIDLLLILGAMLLSLLIFWCLSLFWRVFCPALCQSERNRLLITPSPNGKGEYGAIMDADGTLPKVAEGQDSSPMVEKEEDHDDDDKATLLSPTYSHRGAVPLYGLDGKNEPKSVSETAL